MNSNTFSSFKSIEKVLRTRQPSLIKDNKLMAIGWFILINIAVTLSLTIISAGELLKIIPFLLLIGFTMPFVELVLSSHLVKALEDIRLIDEGTYENNREKQLFEIVKVLSKNANLPVIPEVGIYKDNEMNAFATGFTKQKSIIAFSSGLVKKMNDEEITAVAAHEIGHIANGDMVISTLVQSVLNVFIYMITIPLLILNIVAFFSDELDEGCYTILYWIRFVIRSVLMFLGALIANIFSRHREFKADELAAVLVDRDSMIKALRTLGESELSASKKQMRYAAYKINGKTRFLEILSTHPSVERRIERLMKLK